MKIITKLLIILSIAGATKANGHALSQTKINGFFTSGVTTLDTDGVVYQSGETNRPSFEANSRVGLNIFGEISENAEVISQLTMYPTSDSRAIFDWGFLAYHIRENLTLRIGKIKSPAWLVSDYIDIGYAYPWIKPPEEVYSLNPVKNFRGISLEYQIEFVGMTLNIEPFVGAIKTEVLTYDNSGDLSRNYGSANNFRGLSFKLDIENILIRGSYITTHVDFAPDLGFDESTDIRLRRNASFMNLGIKGELKNFVLFSEFAKSDSKLNEEKIDELQRSFAQAILAGDTAAQGKISQELVYEQARFLGQTSYYVTLGYRYEQFLPHFTYASLKQPNGLVVSFGDQTSMALGLKTILKEGLDLKLEIKQINPESGTNGIFATPNALSNEADIGSVMQYSLVFDALF